MPAKPTPDKPALRDLNLVTIKRSTAIKGSKSASLKDSHFALWIVASLQATGGPLVGPLVVFISRARRGIWIRCLTRHHHYHNIGP